MACNQLLPNDNDVKTQLNLVGSAEVDKKMKNVFGNIFSRVSKELKEYSSKINWFIFLFIVVFTVGSWIDINGMWCELPIMVHELPERWRLPSILSAITQLSQIGPILFLISRWLCPRYVKFTTTIYIILGIGALSCLLLAFIWSKTAHIFGDERSISLYVLQFTLGLLDGTSSVTFLPYIGKHFKKEYIIPNYVGESLAAMLPSILGIIQGVGDDLGCKEVNGTNGTELEPIPLEPRFSVMIYFLLLCLLLIFSTVSFSLLNYTNMGRKERRNDLKIAGELKSSSITAIINDNESREKDKEIPSRIEITILLTIVFCVSFLAYGTLPALQSYSTLPYGNSAFHLSINISYVLLPIVILLSIWSYELSCLRIFIEFLIALAASLYIIIIAVQSPCPILQDIGFGSFLIVLCWIVNTCLFMRIRCCISAKLEICGPKMLLFIGFLTMFGQMCAGLIMYFVVNELKLFKDAPQCRDVLEYCRSRV